ncbi:hypothetical protein Mgra_00006776, partial [Meloidogyne graminicola]
MEDNQEEPLSVETKQLGQQTSSPSSLFHAFILYINIGFCLFIVLSFLYFHFYWRNGRNRLPDRPHFSQVSTFWNELNTTNRQQRQEEEQAKLLRISRLIEDSESSAGEDKNLALSCHQSKLFPLVNCCTVWRGPGSNPFRGQQFLIYSNLKNIKKLKTNIANNISSPLLAPPTLYKYFTVKLVICIAVELANQICPKIPGVVKFCREPKGSPKYSQDGFLPDSELLISVGNNHDKQIIVWEWKTKRKLAESRLTCQVNAMALNDTGKMFVTVGVRHVKFWYIERNGEDNNCVLLQGRSAILSEQRNNTFIACCCLPSNRTFVLTLTRLLIEFIDKKLVNIYQMGEEVPLTLTCSLNYLFIGFLNGTIRILNLTNLEPLIELPKPLPLQKYWKECEGINEEELKYPNVHSVVFHGAQGVLSALYSDRSLYHWQLPSFELEGQQQLLTQNIIKLSSQHFHVGPIFDLETINFQLDGIENNFFLTAGADETVRFWSLICSNISPELKKVLFLSTEIELLTEQLDKNFGGLLSDSLESTTGSRWRTFSLIFNLKQINWPLLAEFEAHEGEILCLDYGFFSIGEDNLILLFASASRDRLIHIFDVKQNYSHLLTLDEHKGPITTIKFVRPYKNSPLLLVSFSGDQLLISREIIFNIKNNLFSTTILFKIDKWPIEKIPNCLAFIENKKTILIGSKNCLLYEINLLNGQLIGTIINKNNFEEKEEQEEGIRITKICVDPSSTFAAILCSDRNVYLFNLKEEKFVEIDSSSGVIGLPSDCVTGLSFLPDCRRLVIVTYSGCIAIWSLPTTLHKKQILPKISLQKASESPDNSSIITTTIEEEDNNNINLFSSTNLFIENPQNSIFSYSTTTTTNIIANKRPSTLQEADDELDSGIGGGGEVGGGGGGNSNSSSATSTAAEQGKKQQSFEIKRVNPLDISNLFCKQEGIEGEGEIINSMLSSSSPMTRPPQRPNPSSNPHNNNNNISSSSSSSQNKQQIFFQHNNHPPIQNTPPHQQYSHFPLLYTHPTQQQQQHLINVTLQQQQQQQPKNSRSMSNLYSTNVLSNQQQQQVKERRKWNIGGTNTQQQQQQMFLQNTNGRVSSSPSPSSTFLSVKSIQQPLTTKDILNSNFLISNGNTKQQQQLCFGSIGNSVSLNAIRNGIIEKQQPLPLQEYDNRNSLSKKFFQTTTNIVNLENDNKKEIWKPNNNCNNQKSSSLLIKNRRSSNLFNTSGGNKELNNNKDNGIIEDGRNVNSFGANINSPCSSSQASTPSGGYGGGEFNNNSLDGIIDNQQQKFGSGGSGGARLALNRIKQRRMAAAAANNNNNNNTFDQLPPSSIGRKTPTTTSHLPPRSRSQSPSQLAMAALLASESASAQRPQSPSVRSVISGSSPSTTTTNNSTRYQLKLYGGINSSSSSSKLRQARQRLKKSQENLAALENGEKCGEEGREEDEEEEPLSRSRSIGNLWITGRRTSLHSTDDRTLIQPKNHREIAKSTTDLLGGLKISNGLAKNEEEIKCSKLGRKLAESRQRLAQSIKDIRRISEPDIQPMLLIPKEENCSQMAETPTFRGGGGGGLLKRGVQKKLDKQWQQYSQPSPIPPINARTFQHYNTPIDESSSSFSSSFANKINNGVFQTTTGISNFTSTGSKRMALHAQECIREMQQASDKLLGTRQLINYDPIIDPEEKRQLLFNVNKAVASFSKRLVSEDDEHSAF